MGSRNTDWDIENLQFDAFQLNLFTFKIIDRRCRLFVDVPISVPADVAGGGFTGGCWLGVAAVASRRRRGGYADSANDRRQRTPATRGSADSVVVVAIAVGLDWRCRRRTERTVLNSVRRQPRTFLHRSAADRSLSTVRLVLLHL